MGGGNSGPCPDFVLNTLAFAFQLRKITENLSQFGAECDSFVDLATASGRLDWPAAPFTTVIPPAHALIYTLPFHYLLDF